MLYREIIAVCSEIHTKHTNTAVWGRTYKLVVHKNPLGFTRFIRFKTKYTKFIFNVCHPAVFNTYINIQRCVSHTQQNFIMFIIVLRQHVSILTESSSGPSKIQILT